MSEPVRVPSPSLSNPSRRIPVPWDSDIPPSTTPTRESETDFLLNTVNPSSPTVIISTACAMNCECGENCAEECCKRKWRSFRGGGCQSFTPDTSGKTLRSPVEVVTRDDQSSVSSYGSTDSSQPLVQNQARDLVCQSPSGGPTFVVAVRGSSDPEQSVRCGCHVKVKDGTTTKARNKLILAAIIALLFMAGEFTGGYFANSLAIMTDAAHMLSDFASFLISLFAIWVGTRPPSRRFSFGWHRAEVMGAVISVLIIWVLTGVLVYEAILRVIHRNYTIDANVMLITACVGVFVNVFMILVLHQHSHGHGGGHGHSHRSKKKQRKPEQEDEETVSLTGKQKKTKAGEHRNINVRAAFIHVIGDLIQSIGVVIAGYVIWFKPEWKLADPICTFLFSVLVLISTLNVLKDALRVLMEGTPKHIDYESVKEDLDEIPGVKHAHSLHIWSLTMNKTALAAHLALEAGANNQDVLNRASQMLKQKYSIHQTTLQVEEYQDEMDECGTCQNEKPQKRFSFCWP